MEKKTHESTCAFRACFILEKVNLKEVKVTREDLFDSGIKADSKQKEKKKSKATSKNKSKSKTKTEKTKAKKD